MVRQCSPFAALSCGVALLLVGIQNASLCHGYGDPSDSFPAESNLVERFVVSRNDRIHESFPDLAMAANGDLVVTYQESESHGGGAASSIVARTSGDEGRTWSERIVVAHSADRVRTGWLNCSRILRLHDDSLLIAVDRIPQSNIPAQAHHFWADNRAVMLLFRSQDHGRTWTGPEETPVRGGIVPSLRQLRDGTLLAGITRFDEDDNWRQYQLLFRSRDKGLTWQGPTTVAKDSRTQPNEGDFVELPGGEVVCYLRDDEPGSTSGLRCVSHDGGRTWGPIAHCGRWRFSGRPAAGLLAEGRILVTTRVGAPQAGNWFGAFVESPENALGRADEGSHSVLIENDTNPERPDHGYSGWVELPDGSVYVVQYITADAPAHKPFIRGYRIQRSFFGKTSDM